MNVKQLREMVRRELKHLTENEDEMPASQDEMEMAMNQLNFIQYAADEMEDYLEDNQGGFPEWLQNKLTDVHAKMKDIHAYIEGERR